MTKQSYRPLDSLRQGGAPKGIRETFSLDLFTTTGSFTLPVTLTPAGKDAMIAYPKTFSVV